MKLHQYRFFYVLTGVVCLWYLISPMRSSHLFYQGAKIQIQTQYPQGFTKKRVLIDPGHGCQDPGKVTHVRGALFEHQFNWVLSTILMNHLNQTGKFEAFLTRETEGVGRENSYCLSGGKNKINIAKRGQMAKLRKADVLLSIHADAGQFRGSWLIWSNKKQAQPFAEENERLALSIGANLYEDGFPMLHYHTGYVRFLAELLGIIYITSNDRYGIHRDNFGLALLKNTEVPAVLIETHFISNPSEVKRFQNQATYTAYAKSIEKGLITYFSQ